MNLKSVLFFCMLIFICRNANSQSIITEKEDKISWSLYLLTSAHLESINGPPDTWSDIGFGGGMTYQFNSGLGINTRLNFRQWDRFGFDKSSIPLYIGPFYEFQKGSKLSFALYGGIGPALIWGNDYASIFASFDVGAGMYWNAWSNNQIFFRAGFAQGMSFNGGFEYIDLSFGIRI